MRRAGTVRAPSMRAPASHAGRGIPCFMTGSRPARPTSGRRCRSTTNTALVFLPTSSPSPDFFGGKRPGNDDHANSVVALRAETGDLVWSFQAVHHDVWD